MPVKQNHTYIFGFYVYHQLDVLRERSLLSAVAWKSWYTFERINYALVPEKFLTHRHRIRRQSFKLVFVPLTYRHQRSYRSSETT
jgi:hypothetical protein